MQDFSSIVFSDEGQILFGSIDPDLDYNQLIRPWKSRLGIFYIEHQSIYTDMKLIYLTLLSIFNRKKALDQINRMLKNFSADEKLIIVSSRKSPLVPYPPPGSDFIVKKV